MLFKFVADLVPWEKLIGLAGGAIFGRLAYLFIDSALAQADLVPWDKLIGLTGGAAWGVISYLFITDRICTRNSAQRELDFVKALCDREVAGWKEIAKAHQERADKCDARMVQSLQIAKESVKATEAVVKGSS